MIKLSNSEVFQRQQKTISTLAQENLDLMEMVAEQLYYICLIRNGGNRRMTYNLCKKAD